MMNNNDAYNRAPDAYNPDAAASGAMTQAGFINRVFGWMTVGLALTGIVAWAVAGTPALRELVFANRGIFMILFIVQLVMVIGLTAAINKISSAAAAAGFVAYSIITGVVFSSIFLVYTSQSIASAFFVASGTFGGAGLYGYITKRDLTGLGSLCLMAVWGLIIAMIVNIFFYNRIADFAISAIGVLVFTGLTAYDLQKIRRHAAAAEAGLFDGETSKKIAIIGALELYLDFINIFLYLLRLFGNRR